MSASNKLKTPPQRKHRARMGHSYSFFLAES